MARLEVPRTVICLSQYRTVGRSERIIGPNLAGPAAAEPRRPVRTDRMSGPQRASLGVLALALGLLALTGAYVGLSLAGPSDGALRAIPASNGLLVVAVEDEPGNDALRLGDVIVAVEGRSVEAWME